MIRPRGFLVLPSSDLKKSVSQYREPVLVYLDIDSLGKSWEKTISNLSRKENVFFGIIDIKNKIKRFVDLLHLGMVDYIPTTRIKIEPNEKSVKKVVTYLKRFRTSALNFQQNEKKSNRSIDYIPVFRGWQDIKPGREYTFSIMFIELDEREEMTKRYGKSNLENALSVFQKYIERHVNAFGGRLWIWSNFGGVILFPFDSAECNSVLCGFRILIYKFLHDVEESYFPNFISFRIALHLGNLVYQEKNKGEVISDSINSVFHIGQKFAEPGNFYLTKDVFQYTPEPLKPYFKSCGTFEGRNVLRMKLPIL